MDEVSQLRKQIDEVDSHMLLLVQKRITIMKAIGAAKNKQGTDIKDTVRESEKIQLLEEKAYAYGIPIEIIHTIWHIFFRLAEEIEK